MTKHCLYIRAFYHNFFKVLCIAKPAVVNISVYMHA